jgi:CheY-like chemotaxis protein
MDQSFGLQRAPTAPFIAEGAEGYEGDNTDVIPNESAGPKQALTPHRVLICEDERDAAETLAVLLRFEGHEVSIAHDGPSAIAQAQKWRPTVAVVDIGLPGATGYAVAQSIRGLPDGREVLLIAITGYGSAADIEMARYAGFDWHFSKPAHPSFIYEVMKDPLRAPIHRRDGVPLSRTP